MDDVRFGRRKARLGRIGVVRFVVDNDDVLVRRQLAQNPPREGHVGLAAFFTTERFASFNGISMCQFSISTSAWFSF